MGQAGILATQCFPGPHLKGFNMPNNLKPEEFDYFHELIAHQEATRIGSPGVTDALKAGFCIGLPPVIKFARKDIAERVTRECVLG